MQVNLKLLTGKKNMCLLPIPIRPGLYGDESNLNIFVTTNNWNEVFNLQEEIGGRAAILALDAGGCDVKTAAAFRLIKKSQLITCFSSVSDKQRETAGLLKIPKILATSMNLSEHDVIRTLKVEILDSSNLGKSSLFVRLLHGLRVGTCQALLFAIPLAILGCWELIIGISLVYASAILLSIIWPILPVVGHIKGLLGGVILSVCSAFLVTGNEIDSQFCFIAIANLLISIWVGWMLEGLKSG